jgi:putative ABC transport system permease protein
MISPDTMKNMRELEIKINGILATSLLLILISSSLIFFIVSGEIIRDYTIYGVYKGLGFSLPQIKNLNGSKYVMLIIGAYPISLILSFFVTKLILSVYAQSTGAGLLQPKLLLPSIISLALISLIVFLTILAASKKLNRLKPAEAIRYGYQATFKTRRIKERIYSSPVKMIAMKELFIHPLRNGVKVVTITGLAVLIFSLSMVSDTVSNLFTTELTVGLPESEMFVMTNGSHLNRAIEFILYDLENEDGIEKITPIIASLNNYYLDDGERINLLGQGYASYDNQNLQVIEGKNPSLPDQVAITPTLSRMSGKGIGDMIQINIEGSFQNLTITGIYQIFSNNGVAFRAIKETFYNSNPETKDSWIALTLKEGTNLKGMKSQLSSHYGGNLTIHIFDEFVDGIVGGIDSGFSAFSNIIFAVVSFICFLAIYNLIWIHMIENKKQYGLLKSVGMSHRDLRAIQLFKMSILTAISCFLAIIISQFIVPDIMVSLLSLMGISEINASLSVMWILIATCFIFFLTLGSTTLAVRSQRHINLRQLIIE